MIEPLYELGKINAYTYSFKSKGQKGAIQKVVQFSRLDEKSQLYNLGFGDWDANTGDIDDKSRSNNGDKDKVLATVAAITLNFIEDNPGVSVYATGSTQSRTREYQMGISRFYDEIKDKYELRGLVNGEWKAFERNTNYQAFIIRKR